MTPASTLYGTRQAREASASRSFGPLLGGAPCLDFVNTVDRHDDPTATDDLGSGYIRLVQWCHHAGLIGHEAAEELRIAAGNDPRAAAAVRRRALGVRSALHGILTAILGGEVPVRDDLDSLNAEIREVRSHETLVGTSRGLAWSVTEPSALDFPLRVVVDDAVDLLVSDRVERIRRCANPSCERVFLDSSRNGSRQFCSASGCGSLIRVQRFRARQKTSG